MNIFTKILLATTSLLGIGCHAQPVGNAVWHDELSYGYMDVEDDKDARKAFNFAKKYGNYKDYYARFHLGNLYFVDGSSPAPSFTNDLKGEAGALGVILGTEPRLVSLPDKDLFAQFMAAIRPNPEKLEIETRLYVMEYLADTGEILSEQKIERSKKHDAFKMYQSEPLPPTWVEENGILLFDYYSYRLEEEYNHVLVRCQLRVDSSQQYTISCHDVPYREDS